MYDTFSADYDRFVNWDARLGYELPFLERHLQAISGDNPRSIRVLDAACGTGQHAIALARRGYAAAGADLSPGMIARAQANAAAAGVMLPFKANGFGALAAAFQDGPLFPFDALLCLGNSLPHLLSPEALAAALADFAGCLRPGGLLLVQNRNFDAVLARRARWMEPQAHREGEQEWLFLRFYDYEPDGLITFNLIQLQREAGGPWQQSVLSTPLRPLSQVDLSAALSSAGFGTIDLYGDLAGSPFDPGTSGNLVVTARRG